ncbi:MAG: hypothetical protein GY827_05275 [Cytophagales bacterium]|nr:hypothetical protein [Cytophagales bacterium]
MNFQEISNGFLSGLKDLGNGLTGKTEKDLQSRQMDMQEQYLDFLKEESDTVNQGQAKWLFITLIFIIFLVIILLFLHRKYHIFSI